MIISQSWLQKTIFPPIKFLCEKKDGHSKRESKELINLHLKRVFVGWYH